jgi:outer membrane lipoprotein carrier protein
MNKSRPAPVVAALCLLLASVPGVQAEALPGFVTAFFSDLETVRADFDQQVVDDNNRLQQSSQGRMWIKRPGRFRWDYEAPYRQQLVADGERLWSYDEDLEQVTVQTADEVLTATPAMLLSGVQPLEKVFEIEISGAQAVRLTPRADDSNITGLELQFEDGTLKRIKARDSFGNTTSFTFSNMERNASLEQDVFHFEPPAGADVVGDIE